MSRTMKANLPVGLPCRLSPYGKILWPMALAVVLGVGCRGSSDAEYSVIKDTSTSKPDAATVKDVPSDVPSDATLSDVVAPDAVSATDAVAPDTADAGTDVVADSAADVPADVPAPAGHCDSMKKCLIKDNFGCVIHEHWDPGQKKCIEDNDPQKVAEEACWCTGAVNDQGIGTECHPDCLPCQGLKANCCLVDGKQYGGICTHDCKTDADCGEGAACSGQKKVCLPKSCDGLYGWKGFYSTQLKNKALNPGFPCSSGSVNGLGVGTKCSSAADCQTLQATICLGAPEYMAGMNPVSFCTLLCEFDEQCGANAKCLHSNGKPYFCVPNLCCDMFDPTKEGTLFLWQSGGAPPPPTCGK